MSQLEKYYFDEFLSEPNIGAVDFVYLHTPEGQYLFDEIELTTYDTRAIRSARLAGHALLSSADFTGYVSSEGDGEITMRRDS